MYCLQKVLQMKKDIYKYNLYKQGTGDPKPEPCGTPAVTGAQPED